MELKQRFTKLNLFSKVLIFLFAFKLVLAITPIEISDCILRLKIYQSINFLVVFTLFLGVIYQLYFKDFRNLGFANIILTVPLLLLFVIACFFIWMGCVTENGKRLYDNRLDNSYIIVRRLNCGATTDYSDNICYVKPISSNFNLIWEIDTSKLNKIIWKRL